MKKLVFATNNNHKIKEMKAILSGSFEILSLSDINCFEEIAETSDTLAGNAEQKANWIKDNFQVDCFADDTGLEVEYLGGAPGVYSARYAGENVSYSDNNEKLLKNLQSATNRKAAFKTVICLKLDGETYFFYGEVQGKIIEENRGTSGFGYDPIFIPEGYNLTFAELGDSIKNEISHRAKATKKLIEFLSSRNEPSDL
ncbi:MAG: non-canonical purine NTP pyrophosphatase [Bacteroidetes bacterium CG2_30_33_31]|nr:MAG: non-canonical purine NTP pyrophosphatase [Bacteroidetes bacterium CG2_30_33_31]